MKWSFGRNSCTANEIASGPGASIQSLAQMQPFLNRYGLNATEMAILTSGAHGVAGAANVVEESDVFSFLFATKSSGVDFIKKSIQADFQFFGTWYENPCYYRTSSSQTYNAIPNIRFGERFPDALSGNAIGRFPSDMLFFPTRLKELSFGETFFQKPDFSPAIVDAEKKLLSFNEASFNKAFGAVFAKMLLIGTSAQLTPFSDGSTTC